MWEIETEDIKLVLEKHGSPQALDAAQAILVEEKARISKAAMRYAFTEERADSALNEIEDILIENGILVSSKKFSTP